MRLDETVFGTFCDHHRTYTVTAAPQPDAIRVFAGDPLSGDEVCTITNLSQRPHTTWQPKWHPNLPVWKHRITTQATHLWHTTTHPPPPTSTQPLRNATRTTRTTTTTTVHNHHDR